MQDAAELAGRRGEGDERRSSTETTAWDPVPPWLRSYRSGEFDIPTGIG